MSAQPDTAHATAWPAPVIPPGRLAEIQTELAREWSRVCSEAAQGTLNCPADRRFSSAQWASSPVYLLMAHAYVLSARAMGQMVEAAPLNDHVRNRLRFAVMQWLEAASPSNFMATNPDVQRALIESHGESLRAGLQNLLHDLQKGRLSQTDESRFRLGENVGITPGSVVFENALMQLIEYSPSTARVYKKPLLIVPPCINKYYILDLQPENSFVRYAVDQGFTVFMISWRNPQASDTDGIDKATWSDYLQSGVLQALDVVRDISRQSQVNALGFCVGGTLLASALALAKAQKDDPVSALTLLASMLDFYDTGILDVFVDELHASIRENQLSGGGLMTARELGTTFSFLRPNELVWNYIVNNYLKGEAPPSFDLLSWNADGTNLPGPFFAWYFRNAYLENNLKVPGRVKVNGYGLDLSSLTMPAYVFGSQEDHIVPWRTAYASTAILRGPLRFVLGASGHIAGVINPPAKNRRSYWTHAATDPYADMPHDPEVWMQNATSHQGSWWPDWSNWLAAHSGARRAARSNPGNVRYRPIEPAPGRYVMVRAE